MDRRVFAGVALLVLAAGCHKAEVPPPPARDVPVAPVTPVAPGASGVLPGVSLAVPSDEDTAAEVADLAGDDPTSPRCSGVRLELATKKDAQGHTGFVATLVNGGTKPVTLVEPGDGSDVGWRTPVINWKVTAADGKIVPRPRQGRCGNVNSMSESEIFTLKPGARHVLGEWLGEPYAPGGRYSVRLVYDNDPNHEQKGVELGATGDAVRAKIKKSTVCRVESNAVTADLAAY